MRQDAFLKILETKESYVIEVSKLSKSFGEFVAVDDVSFVAEKGQVLGFLGPNGAGKSTTMKMLTCFIEPSSGSAKVAGFDIKEQSIEVRRSIGYLAESAPSYGEMTVSEFLRFIAEMRGFQKTGIQKAAEKMRELCFLKEAWNQPIETLSKGFRQRVGFAQSLIHDPPVLILDEPTDGLDPNQKHEVRQLIKSMSDTKTIILSTHILEEVEEVCDRVVIIAEGKLVADATPEALMSESRIHNAVTISLPSQRIEKLRQKIAAFSSVDSIEELSNINERATLRMIARNRVSIVDQLTPVLKESDLEIGEIYVERGRLDEVFRSVTKGGIQ